MGGNIKVNNIYGEEIRPDKINLLSFDINRLRKTVKNFCYTLNKDFDNNLWREEDIDNGAIFNGSTRSIMNPTLQPYDILRHKTVLNDIDIMINKRVKERFVNYLKNKQNKVISEDVIYVGISEKALKKYNNICCIFKIYDVGSSSNINVQIDFILSDFKNGQPTEWAWFSNSSNWEDIKENIKGLHHKKLLKALSLLIDKTDQGIVITPKERQPKKNQPNIIMLNYDENNGLSYNFRQAYKRRDEILYINDLPCYLEIDKDKINYIKDVKEIIKILFNLSVISDEDYKDAWSFKGLIKLCNKYLTCEEIRTVFINYFNSLWGLDPYSKKVCKNNDILDFYIKFKGFEYFVKNVKETFNDDKLYSNKIKQYYENF